MLENKETSKESSSRKYILEFTMPSGNKMAATGIEGKFALSPISENGAKGTFLVWDTPQEIHEFLAHLKAQGSPFFKRIMMLRPEIKKVVFTEVGMFPG